MAHQVYAHASLATLEDLGAAEALRRQLEALGLELRRLELPEPSQQVPAAQTNALLLTQGAFALLAVCGLRVLNLVAAQLTGQTRQIGVAKAESRRVTEVHLLMVVEFLAARQAVRLPVARALGPRRGGAQQSPPSARPIRLRRHVDPAAAAL